jgi:alpha-1,6-mannosyltransferase
MKPLSPEMLSYGGLSLGLYLYVAYAVPRESFYLFIALFGALFALYLLLMKHAQEAPKQIKTFLWFAVACRVALLFATPMLTDDIYRHLWDGNLLAFGESPFSALPRTYGAALAYDQLHEDLAPLIASRDFYASYPPVPLLLFRLASGATYDLGVAIFLLKLILLCFELGVLWLFYKLAPLLSLPPHATLWYALNPLVILELSANAHLESVMIFFLLLMLLFLLQKKEMWAMVAFGAAIASKTLPVVFVPLLWRYLGLRRGLVGMCVAALVSLAVYPLVIFSWSDFIHYLEGLNSLLRYFEFNSSLLRLARWIDYDLFTRELISKLFLPFLLAGALLLAFYKPITLQRLPERLIYTFTWQLFCSAIVHPWYLSTLLALSCLCAVRFPVFWSALIPATYIAYVSKPVEQNVAIILFEYVALLLWMNHERNLNRENEMLSSNPKP